MRNRENCLNLNITTMAAVYTDRWIDRETGRQADRRKDGEIVS